MASKMPPIPGTADIWLPEANEWTELEDTARAVFSRYGYGELRTPVFERTEVFTRSLGDETEVVQKEMYTFEDRGGRSLTLRPEGTAGVMRAIANEGLNQGEEKRVFYMGPMFRGERPAAGRRRQFHQIGVEAVGKCTPGVDAECIAMIMRYLAEIGLTDLRLLINTRGTADDREQVGAALHEFLKPKIDGMCEDCRNRLERNVWRILDCKAPQCQEVVESAPRLVDLMNDESRSFFESVCRMLDAMGVEYELAPRLVRGLDYYEHTVFEVLCDREDLGSQNALAGGGRYRITLPGTKKPVEGVGFALGVERLLMARGWEETETSSLGDVDAYIAVIGDGLVPQGLALAETLRAGGVRVLVETEGRSMKAQMRTADKCGAAITCILGEAEAEAGQVMCKDMRDSEQETVAQADAIAWIQGRLH
jgi:histidyl-tRNA synthetase